MKSGFTLIEVLIATAIASIAGLLLTNAMFQIQRSRTYVDRYTDLYSRAALVHHQLTRDISGAFIPVEAALETDTKNENQKASAEKKKPIEKVFYSINEGSLLSTLSCITNNPVVGYWGKQVGSPQPLVARIVYRLQKDKAHKGSYILSRQQGNQLAFDEYKDNKVRSYELINGIKEFSVEYVAMIEKQQQTEKTTETKTDQQQIVKKETKTKIERERKTFKDWQIDSKKQAEQKKQNKQIIPLIPHWMIIKISLWDNEYKRATPFEFVIPITTSLDRSLYPPQKHEPIKQNPKQRVIPSRPQQQVRRIRRVPGPQFRDKFMRANRIKTKKYTIAYNRSGRPELQVINEK